MADDMHMEAETPDQVQQRSSILYLVGIAVIIFIVAELNNQLFNYLPLYFVEHPEFGYWQFISSMFMHGSLMHLVFNMYALWAFGSPLEQLWGTRRFLIFFFLAGLGAGLVYSLVNYVHFTTVYDALLANGLDEQTLQDFLSSGQIDLQQHPGISQDSLKDAFLTFHTPAVGASGAIYGILVAFAMRFPNVKMIFIFLPFPIAAKYFMPLLIGADLFFGITSYSMGNIAHFAHIGGAVIGFLLALLWLRPPRQGPVYADYEVIEEDSPPERPDR